MAKKAKSKKEPKAKPKSAPAPKPKKVDPVEALTARVAEVEGDIARLATLMGKVMGDPYASEAKKIAKKVQG